jgi:hypothetical protein
MARPWIRRIGRIAIATIVVIVIAGALLWTALFWWKRLSLPLDSQMVIASVVPAVLLLTAIWWLWWQLPKRQARKLDIADPKDRVDIEDDFRKTIGQALGGAAVLIGAAFAYLQFTDQQQATQAQLQASHEVLISNQVSKGFEQLASDKIAERLGGIYALEGVMNTSPEYHQPVLEALCAFVRDSTTRQKGLLTVLLEAFSVSGDGTARNANDTPNTIQAPANDVQAALTVIGRRKLGSGSVDLFAARIPNVGLGRANLSDADLIRANLSGANLGLADLNGAYLTSADLSRAVLGSANLSGAHLLNANLSDTMIPCCSARTSPEPTWASPACAKPTCATPT